MTNRKAEVFAANGDDVAAALRNWQQIDGPGFDSFAAKAVERQYLADYRRWAGRRTVAVVTERPSPEARLFTPPPAHTKATEVRSKLVHDGHEVNLLDLAGAEGAAVIRRIVVRDAGPAATTLERCDEMRTIADLIEAQSVELGRPVSVREVLGLAA
jgi:hypothetical protein